MVDDAAGGEGPGPATPLAPGPLVTIGDGALEVDIAARAGGRIAQIRCDGVEQLVGHGEHGAEAAIAWGCYPMVPWCGRIREGRFAFQGREYRLPVNLGDHAIHGVGFLVPWTLHSHGPRHARLELALPQDHRWPFGGTAAQRIEVSGRGLALELSVTAGAQAMPVAIGWHPWFRKPERMVFEPEAMYPRDSQGIAVLPPGPVQPGPWDDCFVNRREVVLYRGGQCIRLASECSDWVVYDAPAFATCVEPQTAPPDAFNLVPGQALQPGETLAARFSLRWE
ncbi:aldose 1-epimerase [Luteimonas wenzhouensis]|jgi:aldose 1-epimerase|uniref:Aldose epimerase n=1 Tax=Luteimonas wenzhouensis TaxID=2599615 RepID=A0A5C5U4I7_9GAMM|nr:aldose epimerase [Luteimonas wenzhouensis]NLW97043.1 aldose epimerase [Xanthomonadaceae bacterium]TWT20678.1 aldose epimerase [Luteimonas wenzhouensis]